MKTIQQLFFACLFFLVTSNVALAALGEATLSVDGKAVSNNASVALSNAKLSLQLQGELQRIEMQIVHAGQVKNQASYQHLSAFNANASNMARMMAKAGDQLKVKVTFNDGTTQEFTLQLS